MSRGICKRAYRLPRKPFKTYWQQTKKDARKYLLNAANFHMLRFLHRWTIDNLSRAVQLSGIALDVGSHDLDMQKVMLNFAEILRTRSEKTGSYEDLKCSIDLAKGVLRIAFNENYDLSYTVLSMLPWKQYEATGSSESLGR
jgi:hypothetical protein